MFGIGRHFPKSRDLFVSQWLVLKKLSVSEGVCFFPKGQGLRLKKPLKRSGPRSSRVSLVRCLLVEFGCLPF